MFDDGLNADDGSDGVDTSERLHDVSPERPHDVADAHLEQDLRTNRDGPPPYLSPSSASTFNSCPRRWKFRYIDRLPDPAGEAALAGTFAHLVLEHLLELPEAQRTTDEARSIARDVWPEIAEDGDYIALDLDEAAERRFRWLSWTAIEGLWHLEDPTKVRVESTEEKLDTMLGDVPFRGIVDRLEREGEDDSLVVSDYKSGKAPSPKFQSGRLDQVLLYAAAIESSKGERPAVARLLYLGQRIIETPVTQTNIDEALGSLDSTWHQLEASVGAGFYEPSPGPLCGWCPYAASCPEGLQELEARHAAGRIRASAPALAHLANKAELVSAT